MPLSNRLRFLVIIPPLFPLFELALILDYEGRTPFEIPLVFVVYITVTASVLTAALFSLIIEWESNQARHSTARG